MRRTFTVHGRFHVLTLSHSGVRTRVTLAPATARVPPPISSFTPDPKSRRSPYRSVKDIN
jgi:hypothetical protein